MPEYLFRNKDTGEEWTEFMTISGRTQFLEENPHIEQGVLGAPKFMDTVKLGRTKPADGFRDLLKQLKKNNHGSTINDW